MELLISEKELDSIWGLSENTQVVKKSKAIEEAQDLQLFKILGEAFYDELLLQSKNDTVTADNEIVIDKSKKIIAYWAEVYALDRIYANGYNKGYNSNSSDFGEVAERAQMKDQKRTANQKADEYTLRLIEYINNNKSKYPLYTSKDEPTQNLRMAGFAFPASGAENREKNHTLDVISKNI
jgi:hypothetical protein